MSKYLLVVASTPVILAPDVYAVPAGAVEPTTGSVPIAELPTTYKNVSPATFAVNVTLVVPPTVPGVTNNSALTTL